jgi:PAS domain S-box-containing protein
MPLSDPPPATFPPQGSEMGARIRDFDWSSTPLGPMDDWPLSLKTSVGLMLLSPAPMALLWGAEGWLLYNDGYMRIAGARHPAILGRSALEAWPEPEAVAFNSGVIRAGQRGEPLMTHDQYFVLHPRGVPEEIWFDLTYNPILDEQGRPRGMLALVVDNTSRVREEQRRQRAEAELAVAQERIQLALDAGAVLGTWVWTIPQDVFTADARFARTFSMNPQALREGRPLAQVVQSIHPEDSPRIEALIAETVRRGGSYRAEYRVRQLDGSWLWIEANGHCEHDAEGRPLRFPGVLLDIQQRKLEQLRQGFLLSLADRLRTLDDPRAIMAEAAGLLGSYLNIHRVGYAETDLDTRMATFVSDWVDGSVPHLTGSFPLDAFGAGSVRELSRGRTVVYADVTLDERTREVDLSVIQTRAAVGVPLVRDQRLRAVLFLSHREVRAWRPEEVALCEDVGARTWDAVERARAEKALRELNSALERQVQAYTRERTRLWELTPSPFLIADANGLWLSVSPAWTQLLGWPEAELLGRTAEWMEHPEDPARVHAELTQGLRGATPPRFESRLRHQDGSYRWFSWVCVPFEGLLYCVARDVTAEKAHQEELEKTQEQLRQSQKMEAVGQLTGGIAHDFNNLLAGIVGALDLLGRRIQGGKLDNVQRYIDAATASAHRAAALTHRLLAFARRQSLDVKPTDINTRVHSLEELLRRTLGENISLQTRLQADLWTARTDANQLENALLNLVINARDAMPEGGQLTVETTNSQLDDTYTRSFEGLEPGDYVVLSVSDTGTGMPPDVVAKAFDPFFTTKPIGQGTGLGLSMIYGFAKQSGGHVRIYSEVGQGTSVRLYLPRHKEPLQDAAAEQSGERPRGAGETVLVVEDDPAVRMVVVDVLEDLGYRALEAGDAQQALPFLEGPARIDLLVTDVGLPGMNGRQLAEIARQKRPGLRVLFATGYAEGAAVRSGFLAEGMEMITKPFAIDVLAERLRAMINAP